MRDESKRVSLHPNWANLSEEKKDLFCASYGIDREGYPLDAAGLAGLEGKYRTLSGPERYRIPKPDLGKR